MTETEPCSVQSPVVAQLDEKVWKAWQEKNRKSDQRAAANLRLGAKCFGVAAFVAAIVYWFRVA
jgi:hypothetical protein